MKFPPHLSPAPDVPSNVMVTTISSFALGVSWSVPVSNGGRPILRYIITVGGMEVEASSSATSFLLREPMVTLVDNTTYM